MPLPIIHSQSKILRVGLVLGIPKRFAKEDFENVVPICGVQM